MKVYDLADSKKTNPIQSQSKPIQSQFLQAKMNANAFSQKDYENETAFRPQKNKPNQTQFQIERQKEKMERFSQLVRLLL